MALTAHEELMKEFTTRIEQLLAEKAPVNLAAATPAGADRAKVN